MKTCSIIADYAVRQWHGSTITGKHLSQITTCWTDIPNVYLYYHFCTDNLVFSIGLISCSTLFCQTYGEAFGLHPHFRCAPSAIRAFLVAAART